MVSSSGGRPKSRAPRRVATAALVVFAALGPRSSHAQSASDWETARTLMQEGDARRDRKDFKGALESYQAADAIMHVTTTGLEVARTLAQLGSLVEARDQLVAVLRIPPKPNDPSVIADARVAAQALSDDIDARIPGIRVALQGLAPGASSTVSIDGAVIPPAALVAYRRVNPGHHVVVARVGNGERREDVTLAEREKRDVTLDVGAASLVALSPTTAGTASEPEHAAPGSAGGGPWTALAFTGFGVGAVGVIVGFITGIISISKTNAAKSVPPSQGGCTGDNCGPGTYSDINAANATGNVSTVAFIVAGAGVALGVTSLIVGRSPSHTEPGDAAPPRLSVSPWIGPFGGGVRGSF